MYYHIHISVNTEQEVKGWKKTEIVLEKGDNTSHDIMYTKHYRGSGNIDGDVFDIIQQYGSTFSNISRFKIEALNSSHAVNHYNSKVYRELHFKLKIPNTLFHNVRKELKESEDTLNFSLSTNPREVGEQYTSQFLNCRFLDGTFEQSNKHIAAIEKFIGILDNVTYEELKDELSVFDTNFTMDKWWAH